MTDLPTLDRAIASERRIWAYEHRHAPAGTGERAALARLDALLDQRLTATRTPTDAR